jgi:hypothetical protein
MQRQSADEDVTPSNELWDEHGVPEINVLAPGGGCDFDVTHGRPRVFGRADVLAFRN